MTYIQLINRVLVRLREKTVSTPTESEYSSLIAAFVNDAKEHVEKTWDWKALRRELTFNTVASQNDYNLGAGGVASGGTTTEISRLLKDKYGNPCVWNTTDKSRMSLAPLEYMRDLNISAPGNARPGAFAEMRASTGITLRFVPAPDAAYAMKAVFIIPQDDLSASSDVLTVPAAPVWKMALARAMAERGEGMGEDPVILSSEAKIALEDAILADGEESDFMLIPE
jgi:hypothetical protein